MSRLVNLALALSTSTLAMIGLEAAPAHAASTAAPITAAPTTAAPTTPATAAPGAVLVGELGYEGGAYPGSFHPTAGTVEVEFYSMPLALLKHVGPSGKFRIPLGPGKYTVIGCGPSASVVPGAGECSSPLSVDLKSGEVDHVKLVWAYVP